MTDIRMNLNVTSNGTTDNETKKAKKLKDEFNAAANAAERISSGTRAAAQTAAVRSAGVDDRFDYRQARAGRGTGAAGRDFARQAQGLGGIVQVYATFAANLFAVTTAFQALSKAADFENMVKGLDQLGAASGKNLSYMASNLTKVTDGAISLKEAMTTVAQASAAGLSTEQIDKLAIVAKKSSQALGRDMTDSINRLSRGITKMEPELLDEVGIFVRVDKAAADYAQSIGKTAASLTDFERRQAFANAALDQGMKKFGEIDLASNPFSKLQASFVDIIYQGGILLNTVLGPIANLLASSPMALAGAIGLIVTTLAGKALPALGAWKEELQDSANAAAEYSKKLAKDTEEYSAMQSAKKFGEDKKAAQALITQNKLFAEGSKTLESITAATLEKESNLSRVSTEINKKLKDRIQASLDLGKRNDEVSRRNKANIDAEIAAYTQLQRRIDSMQRNIAKDNELTAREVRNNKVAQEASSKAARLNIMSEVSDKLAVTGMLGAMADITDKVNEYNAGLKEGEKGITKMQTGWMKATMAADVMLDTLGTFISKVAFVGAAVGAVVSILVMVDSYFSKINKEAEGLANGIDRAEGAIKVLEDGAERLSKLDPLERMSLDNISAKSSGLKELSAAMEDILTNASLAEQKMGTWDTFVDRLASIFGNSLRDKVAEISSKSILEGIKNIDTSTKAGKELEKKLNTLFGVKGLSVLTEDNLQKRLFFSPEDLDKARKYFKEYSEDQDKSINNMKSSIDSLSEASKEYDNIVRSYTSTNPFTKMAITSFKAFSELKKEITSGTTALAAFRELVTSTDKLKLLPEGTINDLIGTNAELEKLNKKIKSLEAARSKPGSNKLVITKQIEEAQVEMQKLATNSITKAMQASAKKAGENLGTEASRILKQAALKATASLASAIGGPDSARIQARIQIQQIELDIDKLESDKQLILSQERLRISNERISLENKKRETENTLRSKDYAKLSDPEKLQVLTDDKNARRGLKDLELQEKIVSDMSKGITIAPERLQGNLGLLDASEAVRNVNASIKGFRTEQKTIRSIGEINWLRDANEASKRSAELVNANITAYREFNTLLNQYLDKYVEVESLSTSIYNRNEDILRSAADLTSEIDNRRELYEEETKAALANADIQESARKKYEEDIRKIKSEGLIKILTLENAQILDNLKLYDLRAKKLSEISEYTSQVLGVEKEITEVLRSAGVITEAQSRDIFNRIDSEEIILKYYTERIAVSKKLEAIQEQINKDTFSQSIAFSKEVADRLANLQAYSKILSDEEKRLVAKQTFDLEILEAKQKYQKDLVATEERLKEIETGFLGTYTNFIEYSKLGAQDFINKLGEQAEAMESSMSVLNRGAIDAIDSTIDKFYEMTIKGEATLKDVAQVLKDGFKNAFAEAAANNVKKLYKEGLSKIFGTDKKKAGDELQKKTQEAQNRLSVSMGEFVRTVPQLVNALNRFSGGTTTGITTGMRPDLDMSGKHVQLGPIPFEGDGIPLNNPTYTLESSEFIKDPGLLNIGSKLEGLFSWLGDSETPPRYTVGATDIIPNPGLFDKDKGIPFVTWGLSENRNKIEEESLPALSKSAAQIAEELLDKQRQTERSLATEFNPDRFPGLDSPGKYDLIDPSTLSSVDNKLKDLMNFFIGLDNAKNMKASELDVIYETGRGISEEELLRDSKYWQSLELETKAMGEEAKKGIQGLGKGLTDSLKEAEDWGSGNILKDLMNGLGGLGKGLDSMLNSAKDWIAKAVTGGGMNTAGGSSFLSILGSAIPMMFAANGGIFNGSRGLSAYSNSIVSSPTMFAFAKGGVPNMGVMGEAGPEAIIPLKRDSSGKLGVGGSQSNVNVTVHNYGKEQATTRETTDSRGNRSIEVIIGDMVSAEINRPGSNVSNSIQSNFGTRNQLVRR